MNKKELIAKISNNIEITQKDTEIVINSFVETIFETLKNGEEVVIAGFGTFKKVDKAARLGINPSTGARIDIAAKSVPKFVASKNFKESL